MAVEQPAERTVGARGALGALGALGAREATTGGRVEAIHIAAVHSGPLQALSSARLVPGIGIEGDRHATENAKLRRHGGRELTLVEAESLDYLADEHDIRIAPGSTRRNVTTRGVRLTGLIGREFRIGDVRVRGLEQCEPCAHMQELVGQPVLRPLVHRAGIVAEILSEGQIEIGDAITPVD